jgi:ABC-type uncharacterized transport system permease subunit
MMKLTRAASVLAAKQVLLHFVALLLVVVAVPLLAGFALTARIMIPVLVPAGICAVCLSPTLRSALLGGKSPW